MIEDKIDNAMREYAERYQGLKEEYHIKLHDLSIDVHSFLDKHVRKAKDKDYYLRRYWKMREGKL